MQHRGENLATCAILGLFAWHVSRLWDIHPDAPVTAARALGEGTVQSTDLWSLILGVAHFAGAPLPSTALAAGALLGAASLAVALTLLRALHIEGPLAWFSAAALALSPTFVTSAANGTEAQLFVALIGYSLVLYLRADSEPHLYRRLAIFLALATMTRIEGFLVLVVLLTHRLALAAIRDRRPPPRAVWTAALWYVALAGGWFAWRCWKQGHGLPTTGSTELTPLVHWANDTGLVYASPLVALSLLARRGTRHWVFITATLPVSVLLASYAMWSRSPLALVPVLWLSAVLCSVGLWRLSTWVPARSHIATIVAVAVLSAKGYTERHSLAPTADKPQESKEIPR